MQTWDAIRARRNVRTYTDRPLEPGALERILEAGRITPSARNSQPWDFIVVTERERLIELAKVWTGGRHVAGSAATIALITPIVEEERSRELAAYDLGQATMSIMLAAADQGIGSGHSAVGDQALARELLGFPADRRCAYLIALGYPADRALAPLTRINRRSLEEVVHRERW